MFQYQGASNGFAEALGTYGQRLETIYRAVLGRDLGKVTRLISPQLYHTAFSKEDNPSRPIAKDRVDSTNNLFGIAATLTLFEETVLRELDKRVLKQLGFDPTMWVNRIYDKSTQRYSTQRYSSVWPLSMQRTFERLDIGSLLEYTSNWQDKVPHEDIFSSLFTFINSMARYKVMKVNPKDVSDLEELASGGSLLGIEGDSSFCALVISPSATKVDIQNTGRVDLRDTSRLVTTPFITLSDYTAKEINSKQLEGSGIPPHLAAYIHEFHHFVVYALQRLPTNVGITLLMHGTAGTNGTQT